MILPPGAWLRPVAIASKPAGDAMPSWIRVAWMASAGSKIDLPAIRTTVGMLVGSTVDACCEIVLEAVCVVSRAL